MGWVPLPSPHQVWVHSCCSRTKLKIALSDVSVTAIEVDILMGSLLGECKTHILPIMSHPPARTSDLSFEEFMNACIENGRCHLKLDFKDLAALEPCLIHIAAVKESLAANGQAVWINADVVPGPNMRNQPCVIPAVSFMEAIVEHCPGIPLSLGWRCNRACGDAYTKVDCDAMVALYDIYRHRMEADFSRETHEDSFAPQSLPSGKHRSGSANLVFAASVRLAARGPGPLISLINEIPGSQLLLWTGTGERAVAPWTIAQLRKTFEQCSMDSRVGYDCYVAKSELHGCVSNFFECFEAVGYWLALRLAGATRIKKQQ